MDERKKAKMKKKLMGLRKVSTKEAISSSGGTDPFPALMAAAGLAGAAYVASKKGPHPRGFQKHRARVATTLRGKEVTIEVDHRHKLQVALLVALINSDDPAVDQAIEDFDLELRDVDGELVWPRPALEQLAAVNDWKE
jgi:hypothetical protein